MHRLATGFSVLFIGLIAGNLQPLHAQGAGSDDDAKKAFYTQKVLPVFEANCFRCHGGMNHRGGLAFDTPAGLKKGGRDGAIVVPGDPANSLLMVLIRHDRPKGDPGPMPPNKPKLSDADIAVVGQWIKAGALIPGK